LKTTNHFGSFLLKGLLPKVVTINSILILSMVAQTLPTKTQEKPPMQNWLSNSGLGSISFPNANEGWAVGTADPQDGERSVCVHWDGTGWKRFRCLGSEMSVLTSVKAIAADDVWAVGMSDKDPLVLHWDGKNWKRMQLDPINKKPFQGLTAVAATSSKDVWVAGTIANVDHLSSIIEHWDGKVWKISYLSPAPTSIDPLSMIPSMSASARNDVWAILNMPIGDNPGASLLHWDGSAWKLFSLPGPHSYWLNGILAESPQSAWVVGSDNETNHNSTAHWDGKTWQIVPSVAAGDHDELKVVAGVSSKELWAAGSRRDTPMIFFEHWDGHKWELVETKEIGELESLIAVSSNDIWGAGQSITQTLTDEGGITAVKSISDALVCHWDGKAWAFSTPFKAPSSAR
jgi:hypothetical protein